MDVVRVWVGAVCWCGSGSGGCGSCSAMVLEQVGAVFVWSRNYALKTQVW